MSAKQRSEVRGQRSGGTPWKLTPLWHVQGTAHFNGEAAQAFDLFVPALNYHAAAYLVDLRFDFDATLDFTRLERAGELLLEVEQPKQKKKRT